jgi:hypothetical protein
VGVNRTSCVFVPITNGKDVGATRRVTVCAKRGNPGFRPACIEPLFTSDPGGNYTVYDAARHLLKNINGGTEAPAYFGEMVESTDPGHNTGRGFFSCRDSGWNRIINPSDSESLKRLT